MEDGPKNKVTGTLSTLFGAAAMVPT